MATYGWEVPVDHFNEIQDWCENQTPAIECGLWNPEELLLGNPDTVEITFDTEEYYKKVRQHFDSKIKVVPNKIK